MHPPTYQYEEDYVIPGIGMTFAEVATRLARRNDLEEIERVAQEMERENTLEHPPSKWWYHFDKMPCFDVATVEDDRRREAFEREDAERGFIRFYLNEEEKPSRYHELVEVHGNLGTQYPTRTILLIYLSHFK